MTAQILVISFSTIASDARVLRQISAVAKHGHVTTVGYGPQPARSDEHLRIPDSAVSLPQTIPGVVKLALRRLDSVELDAPGIQAALEAIGDRTFDLIVSNDTRALPLAFKIRGDAPVWADLHEWAPAERTHVRRWRWFVAPLMEHLCQKYLPQCDATSTVGEEIAKLYEEHFSAKPQTIRNVPPYEDLEPSALTDDGTIRLVHSGGATFGRNIEVMIEAVKDASDHLTLDLYLVPAGDGGAYLDTLKNVAADNPRIRILDPVKPHELPSTLNKYDVGIFWIPPVNMNAQLSLPNKFFDFVQGRLAVAAGPSIEMARIIKQHDLGLVTDDFDKSTITRALESITREQLAKWKQNSHEVARELSFEVESKTIDSIVTSLLS